MQDENVLGGRSPSFRLDALPGVLATEGGLRLWSVAFAIEMPATACDSRLRLEVRGF